MDNSKPLNRIKVMLAERMMSNKELAEQSNRFQMGDKHLSAQLRKSD